MNTHYMKASIFSALVSASLTVNAGVVISPSIINGPSAAAGNVNGLINQSGLSSTYISGITDFNSYLATNPTHIDVASNISRGYASVTPFPVNLDLDFGLSYTITDAVLWNWNWATTAGTDQFEVFSSIDATFSTLTSLGTFNMNEVASNNTAANHQLFDLTDISTQYLRVALQSNHGFSGGSSGVGLVEMAFGAEAPTTSAPTPSAIALLGLGIAGLQISRKRQAITGK
ncbi:MAG: hypothetical protein methR_P0507 [Methyloprofundus sp.]|nr:MAG: hypothetical protein methR_P0507 [Methyloprofundus sp.]